jgi:vacuolar-type H+-ATPase subunit C/Vma6
MIPSQKFIGESPNYESLPAVIRARGTRLLGREVFSRLASGSLEDMELFLLESRYGPGTASSSPQAADLSLEG